ncbi:MAG: hypothetical protein QGH93_03125 [Gammaproteobacteria bacterium]|nr:hypothetical protein [Chromatiales bacterium]MDP6673831.1 hypothetical protein [Gammaproteobacteria bacterium]
MLAPDKHVRFFEGEAVQPAKARLLLNDLSNKTAAEDVMNSQEMDLLVVPIYRERPDPIGILALSGWAIFNWSAIFGAQLRTAG